MVEVWPLGLDFLEIASVWDDLVVFLGSPDCIVFFGRACRSRGAHSQISQRQWLLDATGICNCGGSGFGWSAVFKEFLVSQILVTHCVYKSRPIVLARIVIELTMYFLKIISVEHCIEVRVASWISYLGKNVGAATRL